MKHQRDATVEEPARSTPVYGSCDVLVVGGGPAGSAAAVAAGRLGADIVLVERYGHLGGLSTGGLVFWIDRMTDWEGNLVVAGIGAELIERCGPEATLGPSPSSGARRTRPGRLLARPHRGLAGHGAVVADHRPRGAEAGHQRHGARGRTCTR